MDILLIVTAILSIVIMFVLRCVVDILRYRGKEKQAVMFWQWVSPLAFIASSIGLSVGLTKLFNIFSTDAEIVTPVYAHIIIGIIVGMLIYGGVSLYHSHAEKRRLQTTA